MKLFVIDSNCSWIRSLASAASSWSSVYQCRVYSPLWLPNGLKDVPRMFGERVLGERNIELLSLVPGWRRFPKTSAWALYLKLWCRLDRGVEPTVVLFTFPFYSPLARLIHRYHPSVKLAYHAHDPFEYYSFPEGYIRGHEDALIAVCGQVFAISDRLRDDFLRRYPDIRVETLGNAVSQSFCGAAKFTGTSEEVERVRALGRPVIGCIGQINSSYDWDLLEECSARNHQAQFVFIGNLFEEVSVTERIRLFFKRPNVHWLGPKPHDELKGYMESCDILLNPLAVNKQNDRRDSLRLYDYLSTRVPVFSTPIHGAKRHGALVETPGSKDELIIALGRRPEPISNEMLQERRVYLAANTWSARGRQLLTSLGPTEFPERCDLV
jgi:hypothetical protein